MASRMLSRPYRCGAAFVCRLPDGLVVVAPVSAAPGTYDVAVTTTTPPSGFVDVKVFVVKWLVGLLDDLEGVSLDSRR